VEAVDGEVGAGVLVTTMESVTMEKMQIPVLTNVDVTTMEHVKVSVEKQ
jgi:hypothetical protein